LPINTCFWKLPTSSPNTFTISKFTFSAFKELNSMFIIPLLGLGKTIISLLLTSFSTFNS